MGFSLNDLISKLYKIKSIEAITKIQYSSGPLGFWFYFLFSIHCYKTISLRMRAADLKAAKHGESRLEYGRFGTEIHLNGSLST